MCREALDISECLSKGTEMIRNILSDSYNFTYISTKVSKMSAFSKLNLK